MSGGRFITQVYVEAAHHAGNTVVRPPTWQWSGISTNKGIGAYIGGYMGVI